MKRMKKRLTGGERRELQLRKRYKRFYLKDDARKLLTLRVFRRSPANTPKILIVKLISARTGLFFSRNLYTYG